MSSYVLSQNCSVSIIIPVYNTQQFLSDCIQSVQTQTINNIEIILIDDGSNDYSGTICDAYAEEDYRIHVIHQENKGVSAARNEGIKAAHGDYIMFCDSDDFVDYKWCECLLGLATKYHNAWIASGFHLVDSNGKETKRYYYDAYEDVSKIQEGNYLGLFKSKLFRSVCFQIFDRTLILENNIYFDEQLIYGEDTDFVLRYWEYKTYGVVCNQYSLYSYRHPQQNSLSTRYIGINLFETQRRIDKAFRKFITPNEEQAYMDFLFWDIGLSCLKNVLDDRSPDNMEQRIKDCQNIVDSEEFRDWCKAAVPENTDIPLLAYLRKGDFNKACPYLIKMMNQAKPCWQTSIYELGNLNEGRIVDE